MAVGKSRRQIEALVEADPFYKRVLAPTFGSSSSEPVNCFLSGGLVYFPSGSRKRELLRCFAFRDESN